MLTYNDHLVQWDADKSLASLAFPEVSEWEAISSSRRADGHSSSVWKGYLTEDKKLRAYVFVEDGKVYRTEVSR